MLAGNINVPPRRPNVRGRGSESSNSRRARHPSEVAGGVFLVRDVPLGLLTKGELTMYHYQCDWCGEQIRVASEQHVRANIALVTDQTDYRGKREEEAEPSRFFHVTPRRSRDEWDRLGLEVRNEEIGDCCYTRALRAIEGSGWEEPDAGLEWRLVPVGARLTEDGAIEEPSCDPLDWEPLWTTSTHGHPIPRRDDPRFRLLGSRLMPGVLNGRRYLEADIKTVGDLRRALADGSITRVRGVGPKIAEIIKDAFEEFLASVAAGELDTSKGRAGAVTA